jgi:hypothetical protein
MSTPANIIRQLLLDLNLGQADTKQAWAVYVGFMPDTPDDAICVYDTAGKLDGRMMRTGQQIEHEGIQVRVRGLLYPTTIAKAYGIALAFDEQKRSAVTADAANYLIQNISRSGAVLNLGVEDTDRHRYHFTINATLTIEPQE